MSTTKEMSRNQKFRLNTITALIKQVIMLISGLILPRFILLSYGSEVNGLVSSITQFLGFIALLEMGIGPVIQSNLYKPLADKDNRKISEIFVSASRFFRKIGYIFLVYIAVLVIFYPQFVHAEFDYGFTASLIVIISISMLAEYFFGMTYQLLLNADQLAWVQLSVQTVCILINTILCVLLMINGQDIRLVKGVTSFIYVVRPFLLMIYVKRHYSIDCHVQYKKEPIQQKWNGFTQHLAAVVNSRTDVVVLTIFSTLASVSVYHIYFLVVSGLEQVVMTAMTGLEAMWGNMLAQQEMDTLQNSFSKIETGIHFGVTLLFSVAAVMITSFVLWYTNGIIDTNYNVPVFGMLLTYAYAIECYRIPYFRMIKAAGHYKQTQWASLVQPAINIIISILAVKKYGLVGVAIGTLIAMLYHTTYFAWYLRKNIIARPFRYFVKHFFVDGLVITSIMVSCIPLIQMIHIRGLVDWMIGAAAVLVIAAIESFLMYILFYRKQVKEILRKIR